VIEAIRTVMLASSAILAALAFYNFVDPLAVLEHQ
jgi:hypothetical protein